MAIRVLGGQKNAKSAGGNRILVTVIVHGSAGPIRFLVGERDLVSCVISSALKIYARQGRLPVLGSDPSEFLLFCSHSNYTDALDLKEAIGLKGGRNFVLCKKQLYQISPSNNSRETLSRSSMEKKSGVNWKAWLNKSFHFKVSSH